MSSTSNTPIVVQGYSVYSSDGAQPPPQSSSPYDSQYKASTTNATYAYVPDASPYGPSSHGGAGVGGTAGTDKQFQDVFWGILFYIHLAGMIVLIAIEMSSNSSLYQKSGGGSIITLVSLSALVSVGLSCFVMSMMMHWPIIPMVQVALLFSVASSLAVAVFAFMTSQTLLAILSLVFFALGICYAYLVWHRIPFAAANLRTALISVQQNMGLTLVALIFLGLALVWTVFWMIGFSNYLENYNPFFLFLLLVSLYWVQQVLQNTVHVTVAGVVGTWWFVPSEASSFCSPALNDSLFRATTYSFGSICFGSLLVAVVQALRVLLRITEQNDDCNIMTCIIQCILSCIQAIVEELNKWAYVYIGLYGQSYVEAGRNVVTLFEHRGWTTIITDDLADNVLVMVSLGIGLVTGLLGLICAKADKTIYQGLGNYSQDNIGSVAFGFCFVAGYLFATIFMSIVGSAVNTVIVCFAEAPAEFQTNHPELSAQMRAAWTQAWPELAI